MSTSCRINSRKGLWHILLDVAVVIVVSGCERRKKDWEGRRLRRTIACSPQLLATRDSARLAPARSGPPAGTGRPKSTVTQGVRSTTELSPTVSSSLPNLAGRAITCQA